VAVEGVALGIGKRVGDPARHPQLGLVGPPRRVASARTHATQTVVFGHDALHLAGTSLVRADIETVIALAASRLVNSGVTNGRGFYVSVDGVPIAFRLFVIDGIVRLGTSIPK